MPASRTAQMEKGKAVKWKIDLTLLSLLVGHDNGCFIDSIISQKQTMRPSTSNSIQDVCGKGADRTTEHEPAMEPAVMEPAYPWPYNYALFQTIQGTKTAMIELCDTDSKRSENNLASWPNPESTWTFKFPRKLKTSHQEPQVKQTWFKNGKPSRKNKRHFVEPD